MNPVARDQQASSGGPGSTTFVRVGRSAASTKRFVRGVRNACQSVGGTITCDSRRPWSSTTTLMFRGSVYSGGEGGAMRPRRYVCEQRVGP